MATPLQCPDEPYTINLTICRGRQAKGYEKCPSCPHHHAELPPAPEPTQPVVMLVEEETPAPAPLPVGNRLIAKAASLIPVPAMDQGALGDLRSLARRIYDYF